MLSPSSALRRGTPLPCFWAAEVAFTARFVIVNAHRFIFDSRDDAAEERLEILNDREGVWRCRTIFNCTEACPREIRITKAIGEVKKAILKGSRDITVRQPAGVHHG